MSMTIRTTMRPYEEIVVADDEYLRLLAQDLIWGEAAPGPPNPEDVEVATYLDDETSETYQRLLTQLGAAVAGSNPFADAQRAAFGRVFTPEAYGAVDPTGATDSTAAVQGAVDAAAAAGGVVRFSEGTFRIDSQVNVPYTLDGTGAPRMPAVVLQGSGAWATGRGSGIAMDPVGGTVLDLRYSGAGAKIKAKGFGRLAMRDLTLTDKGTSSSSFIKTTNTTLDIEGCAFIGNKVGTACDQDAIVLGGLTKPGSGDFGTDDDSPFQGYGTRIVGNWFNGVRRVVLGQVYANGVIVRDNTVWQKCGTNLAGGACIEFNPGAAAAASVFGNVITGNLIEVGNYPYGILLDYAQGNSLIGNNFYDQTATTIAYIRTNSVNAKYNMILVGFGVVGAAWPGGVHVSEGTANTNTIIDGSAGPSQFISAPNYIRGLKTSGAFNGGANVPEATFGGAANAAKLFTGGGTPEGAVTAGPGSIYLRTGGGATTSFYVKETGTSNTGWVAK